jgi:DNA-binding CsgD family transcriptional regulator
MRRNNEVTRNDDPRSPVDREAMRNLSAREQQVLSFAAEGYIDKQIGVALGVSVNTLRTYWQRIRSKLGEAPRSALAVAYVEHVAAAARVPRSAEPEHDWEIDLIRNVWKRVSNRPMLFDSPVGIEHAVEELTTHFHPEDQPRIRALLVAMRKGELEAFIYTVRWVSAEGTETVSGLIRLARDEMGRPVRALAGRLPNVELGAPRVAGVQVGHWCLDLQTSRFEADAEYRRMFMIDSDESDIHEAVLERLHPEDREATRRFPLETAAQGIERAMRTHRILMDDGSTRWVTTDLHIEYENGVARTASGTDIAFD